MSNQNGTNNHEKTIIIGSGPAGYTAAIYAARAEMNPLMFSGLQPGGQLMITNDVENYPGYKNGIMGPEMMEDFRLQAERFGTRIKYETIVKVELEGHPKKVWTDGEEMYTADTVTSAPVPPPNGWASRQNNNMPTKGSVPVPCVTDTFFGGRKW